jgi:hypothetical protein
VLLVVTLSEAAVLRRGDWRDSEAMSDRTSFGDSMRSKRESRECPEAGMETRQQRDGGRDSRVPITRRGRDGRVQRTRRVRVQTSLPGCTCPLVRFRWGCSSHPHDAELPLSRCRASTLTLSKLVMTTSISAIPDRRTGSSTPSACERPTTISPLNYRYRNTPSHCRSGSAGTSLLAMVPGLTR